MCVANKRVSPPPSSWLRYTLCVRMNINCGIFMEAYTVSYTLDLRYDCEYVLHRSVFKALSAQTERKLSLGWWLLEQCNAVWCQKTNSIRKNVRQEGLVWFNIFCVNIISASEQYVDIWQWLSTLIVRIVPVKFKTDRRANFQLHNRVYRNATKIQ